MFSKRINLKAIGPRLILWTTLSLALSLLFVSTTVYYLLSSSLRKSDQGVIVNIAKSYQQSINQNGLESLKGKHLPEILIMVVDDKGKEVFTSLPEYLDNDFEDEDEIRQIKTETERLPLKKGWETILLLSGEEDNDFFHRTEHWMRKLAWENEWTSVLPLIDNDMVEVYSTSLENGYWLRVGRSSEEREEHLAKIRNISLVVIVPFIFIGFLVSLFLSRKILSPIKDLAQTIKRIQKGESELFAQIRGTDDEIDVLAKEFNSLLLHNKKLMKNLAGTIDNVAHDLRTPLTRFRASVEYALTKENDQKAFKEAIQDGLENSQKLLELLNAIMDVAEAETQTMKIKKEKIPLKEFLEGIMDLFHYSAEDKEIKLHLEAPQEIFVLGDKVRLGQAFSNLMDNALKYSPNGSQIHIRLLQSGDLATVAIQDQGIGIASENIERIWERLYREDPSRGTPGLGIGLSVVKAIITAHNGHISVQSTPGTGSTFVVTLPLCNDGVSFA